MFIRRHLQQSQQFTLKDLIHLKNLLCILSEDITGENLYLKQAKICSIDFKNKTFWLKLD